MFNEMFLMRSQTLFWIHYKLVIELLEHSHFSRNYLKLQILASCNNFRIEQDSELAKFWPRAKVIYTKYSKHWLYTVANTIDCVCSKMLNHGLNHGLFISLFKLVPCPIHWIVYVLTFLNFIYEFSCSFSTSQNGPLCPDT